MSTEEQKTPDQEVPATDAPAAPETPAETPEPAPEAAPEDAPEERGAVDEDQTPAEAGSLTGNPEVAGMSYGMKAVGLTFNPSGDPRVHAVKEKYAEIIDMLADIRDEVGPSEAGRLLSVAITEAQGAQMWAVKGITWQD